METIQPQPKIDIQTTLKEVLAQNRLILEQNVLIIKAIHNPFVVYPGRDICDECTLTFPHHAPSCSRYVKL